MATQPNLRDDCVIAPRVLPTYLAIRNPVVSRLDDPFVDLSVLADILGNEYAKQIALKFDEHVYDTAIWMEEFCNLYESLAELLTAKPEALNWLYVPAYPIFDCHFVVRALRSRGYDGAIHCGTGETAGEPEYKLFIVN